MIENEHQYKITQKKLQEIIESIDRVNKDITQHPLRNELILASLCNVTQEMEEDIALYESQFNLK